MEMTNEQLLEKVRRQVISSITLAAGRHRSAIESLRDEATLKLGQLDNPSKGAWGGRLRTLPQGLSYEVDRTAVELESVLQYAVSLSISTEEIDEAYRLGAIGHVARLEEAIENARTKASV